MPITRRRLITTSSAGLTAAGTAVALGACGTDGREEPSAERDVELLARPLAAAATLRSLYETATEQALEPEVEDAARAFGEQAGEHVSVLSEAIEEAGGTPADPDPDPPAAESAVEAIRIALEGAIAAGHAVVGELASESAQRSVYEVLIGDAAQLAAIRGVLGEQQVPEAFVTGSPEPPLTVEPEGAGPEQPAEHPEEAP